MDLTGITKQIGDVVAKIKNNNKLIDELNTRYNPTFVEILEDLKDTDSTLAAMLTFWYMNKYSIDESKLDMIMDDIRKQYDLSTNSTTKKKSGTRKPSIPSYSSYDSGCGNNGGSIGCGVPSRKTSWNSGGCGSSSFNDSYC